jgi:hypothetical protein
MRRHVQVSRLASFASFLSVESVASAASWVIALGAVGGIAGIGGCASSGALRAAERGDFATLQKDVAVEEKLGKLSNGEAADLARAVVGWEIEKGPPAEQLARVREARACAAGIDDALARRMKTRDEAGGEAALARVESGELSEGAARDHLADTDDAWRAVGARGLVREGDDAARLRAYVDPAPAVRRAAMHAALRAKDARDVDALAEAARVDPEGIVRTDAVRSLAAIGGAAVVAKLRDLWGGADGPLREDIATAWASPGVWEAGGREDLRVLVAQGRGPAAIQAAGAALGRAPRDAEIEASATALLARLVSGASKPSHRDRVHAIAVTPPRALALASGAILDALREAARDSDVMIDVAALAQLTESAPDRDASIRALEAIAGDKDRSAAATGAKLALANAGDLRVQAWLEADLLSTDPAIRVGAVTALAALGRPGRGAPVLADADPSLRTRAACTILLAPRSSRH